MIVIETEAFIEAAKATQEVANTASKAIDTGNSLDKFIAKLILGPLEQSCRIVEDKLRYIRNER